MLETRRASAPLAVGDREFGLVMAAALVVFSVVSAWKRHGWPATWLPACAAGFLLIALACPRALGPLNRAWSLLGRALHLVVSPVILCVLFFAVVTPFAVVFRLVKRDPLRARIDPSAASYWIERTDEPGKGMANQF